VLIDRDDDSRSKQSKLESKVRLLVLYYSAHGHVEAMAEAIAAGALAVANCAAVVKRVPELVSLEIARQSAYKLEQAAPIATIEELPDYDAYIFGTPTRYGNMAAQMRNFLDQTGGLWSKGAFIGKVGSVFASSASQHGGQETTITSFHTTLFHMGMIVVGVPADGRQIGVEQVSGGSPYGATTITGLGSRWPSENELSIARFQGEHVARVTSMLAAGRALLA
jgi:NAD(P)H dehydrogenase (quinone)